MFRSARVWVIVAVVAVLMAVMPGTAAAHSNLFKSNAYGNTCYSSSQQATGWMKEQGTTGTNWMRITAQFQRWTGYYWYTTQSRYYQNSQQFYNDHGDHTLTYTKRFYYSGADFTQPTRIRFVFRWYNSGNVLVAKGSRASLICS